MKIVGDSNSIRKMNRILIFWEVPSGKLKGKKAIIIIIQQKQQGPVDCQHPDPHF